MTTTIINPADLQKLLEEGSLTITNGPGKWDLISSFANASVLSFSVEISVTKHKEKVDVLISSIEREDGSGESWNLKVNIQGLYYKMYFSSKTRSGVLSLMKT